MVWYETEFYLVYLYILYELLYIFHFLLKAKAKTKTKAIVFRKNLYILH